MPSLFLSVCDARYERVCQIVKLSYWSVQLYPLWHILRSCLNRNPRTFSEARASWRDFLIPSIGRGCYLRRCPQQFVFVLVGQCLVVLVGRQAARHRRLKHGRPMRASAMQHNAAPFIGLQRLKRSQFIAFYRNVVVQIDKTVQRKTTERTSSAQRSWKKNFFLKNAFSGFYCFFTGSY